MIYGMYPLLSGSRSQEKYLEVISNNIANINTAGYKKDFPSFKKVIDNVNGEKNLKYAEFSELNKTVTDFSPGSLTHTGNPLDVAIMGDGQFVVQQGGKQYYTRSGNFSMNSSGELITAQGARVMGKNGVITLPEGNIDIASDGTVSVNGTSVDQLKVVQVSQMKKAGNNIFTMEKNGQETIVEHPEVVQGSLESSNVNPVMEMTEMIQTIRNYESFLKLITTLDETTGKGINEMGRS